MFGLKCKFHRRTGALMLALAVLVAWPATGQDVRVQATVNGTTIGTEERVVFTIEIDGADMADVRTPDAPAAENLILEQAIPSTSRNVSIVNGHMSQSVTYRWGYRPREEGSAQILSTNVHVGDRRFSTDPIRITIVPQSQRPQQAPSAQRSPGWPFGRRQAPQPQAKTSITGDDLFIRAVPSKRQAVMNEQVVIEYHLYGRDYIQLRQSRLTDSWDAEGFWREEMDVEPRPVPRTVVENGLRYKVIVLKRVAVFPTRTGTLRIDPLRIETEVYVSGRSSDPFSAFFPSTSFQPVELNSPPVTIDVRALPPGAPAGFAGAVGRFQLEASLDRQAVEVGESVQATLQVSGTGNLATLVPPKLEAPGIFEQYDPQINTAIERTGRLVRGSKTVTHVLVPRSNGILEMPEISFVYFDPERSSYERLTADLGSLRITGTAESVAESATRAGLPIDDIAGIKIRSVEWRRTGSRPLHTSALAYLAIMVPLLAIGVAVAYQRRANRLASDVRYARSRRAHPLARRHLREAEHLLKRSEPRSFYAEIERALLSFVGNTLDIPEVGLTRQQLDVHLKAHGVSDANRRELYALLDEAEQAQFAPIPPDREAMETAIERAGGVIVAIGEPDRRTARVEV